MATWKQMPSTGIAIGEFKDWILLNSITYNTKVSYLCFAANLLTIRIATKVSSLSSHKWSCFFLSSSVMVVATPFSSLNTHFWAFYLSSEATFLFDGCSDEFSSSRVLFKFSLLRKSFLSTLSEVVFPTLYHVLSILSLKSHLLHLFVAVNIT